MLHHKIINVSDQNRSVTSVHELMTSFTMFLPQVGLDRYRKDWAKSEHVQANLEHSRSTFMCAIQRVQRLPNVAILETTYWEWSTGQSWHRSVSCEIHLSHAPWAWYSYVHFPWTCSLWCMQACPIIDNRHNRPSMCTCTCTSHKQI